jgi:L-asparaginase/Glu-tRNA(Gln) amidotransferase subunit D
MHDTPTSHRRLVIPLDLNASTGAEYGIVLKGLKEHLAAVVINGYSRGSGPADLGPVIEKLSAEGIMFFRASRYAATGGIADCGYESGLKLEEAGAIGLGRMKTLEAIEHIQGMLDQNLGADEIKKRMGQLAINSIEPAQSYPFEQMP